MGSLKIDIVNKLTNDKYFEELELVRLSEEPHIEYKKKIDLMDVVLTNIALINIKLGLLEQYFREPKPKQEKEEK